MKQSTTIAILFLLSFLVTTTKAQLVDGTLAPDFTVVDIDGNTHNLYNTLESGKTTFLVFFATSCTGESWTYHRKNILQDFYNVYGEPGVDLVEVFFIEGRANTESDELDGTSMWSTFNWLEDTPYPVIEDAPVADLYGMPTSSIGLPLIYKVCPKTKTTKQLFTPSYEELVDELLLGECAETRNDYDPALLYITTTNQVCKKDGQPIKIAVANLGVDIIEEIDIVVTDVSTDTQILSFNWTGDLLSLETIEFNLGDIVFDASTVLKFELIDTNDEIIINNKLQEYFEVSDLHFVGDNIELKLKTDSQPLQTYWEVTQNSTDEIIASKGNQHIVYEYNPQDYWSNQEYIHTIPFEESGCYVFTIEDVMGNGICCDGFSDGLYELLFEGDVFASGAEFGFGESKSFYVEVEDQTLNTHTIAGLGNFTIYPNPATNHLFVDLPETIDNNFELTIYNELGKIMYTQNVSNHTMQVDVIDWATGIYFIQLTDGNHTIIDKVLID